MRTNCSVVLQTHWYAGTLTLLNHICLLRRDPPWAYGQRTGTDLRLERRNEFLWSCLMVAGGSSIRVAKGEEACLWDQRRPDSLTWRRKEKKGSWKWQRIKSERKLAPGHFRQRSCYINVSFIFFKWNKLLSNDPESHQCQLWLHTVEREWQWWAMIQVSSWDGIRCLYSFVSLDTCSNFRLSHLSYPQNLVQLSPLGPIRRHTGLGARRQGCHLHSVPSHILCFITSFIFASVSLSVTSKIWAGPVICPGSSWLCEVW